MFANRQNANGWGEVGFFRCASEVGIDHQSTESNTCLHNGHSFRLYKVFLRVAGEKINYGLEFTAITILCSKGTGLFITKV